METELIDEPDLEFGHGGLHPDLRFGVIEFGPADQGKDRKPSEIKLGLVGTEQSIEDAVSWLTTAAKGLEASGSPKRNLFPDFPGFSRGSTFNCDLVFDRSVSMSILAKDIHEAAAHGIMRSASGI
jgi:hypothetical protein